MKKCFIFFSDCDLPFTVAFVTNTAAEDGSAIAQRGKYHTFVFYSEKTFTDMSLYMFFCLHLGFCLQYYQVTCDHGRQ